MDRIIEILGSVGFDWRVALANLVNFSIVAFLVARFIVPSISTTLAKRRETIARGIEDAARAARELESARTKEQEIVRDATLRANDLVAEARMRGDLIVTKAHDEGVEAGAAMIRRAEDEIARKHKELERSVERDAAFLIAEGIRATLKNGLDDADNATLINNVIDRASRRVS